MAKTKSSVPAESLLHVGDKAPMFALMNEADKKVELKSLKGSPLVLYFYPKDLTSGCTQEACDFKDSMTRITKLGAVVLGVSKDLPKTHTKFIEKYDLPFSLLSDPNGATCEAYGVWKEKSMYGRKYMGIERTTFIIDSKGIIAHIFPKVKVNGHVDEVLSVLRNLS